MSVRNDPGNDQLGCVRCRCFRCASDARVTCKRCGGSGKYKMKCFCYGYVVNCDGCDGTSVKVRDCWYCSGEGTCQCDRCNGRGRFPCKACEAEVKRKAEEVARRTAEEEAYKKAEAEAKRKAEEEG